jgi:hypothetical protein
MSLEVMRFNAARRLAKAIEAVRACYPHHGAVAAKSAEEFAAATAKFEAEAAARDADLAALEAVLARLLRPEE